MTEKTGYIKCLAAGVLTVLVTLFLLALFAEHTQAASKGVVVVDPGHVWSSSGAADPGNIGLDGTTEASLNLELGAKIVNELKQRGYTVYTTLPIVSGVKNLINGPSVSLKNRWQAANSVSADMVVCVHHNSIYPANTQPKGWLVLYDDGQIYPEAKKQTKAAATAVRDSLYELSYTRGNRANGLQQQGADVIRYSDAPVVYLEAGFLSNPDDLANAKSSTRQAETAAKVVDGIDNFFIAYPVGKTESAPPLIDSVSFSESSPTTKTSFTITAKGVSASEGISRVKFRVWRNGASSTAKTYTGKNEGNGNWSMPFKLSDFGSVMGTYKVTAYAYDKHNNYTSASGSIVVTRSNDKAIPTMGKLEFVGQTSPTSETEFTIRANDVVDASGVKMVKFTIYHTDNKAGTQQVVAAKRSGGNNWDATFNLADFGGKPGVYKAVASGWDTIGNKGTMKSASIRVMGTDIMGSSQTSVRQMVNYFTANGGVYPSYYEEAPRSTTLEQFAQLYYDISQKEGVRAEVAWAQMCHETGFLKFGGDVKKEQFNFAGLGATGGGEPGFDFGERYGKNARGIKYGVIGQVQHLKCYASTADAVYKNSDGTPVDPRWKYVTRGSAPVVEMMNQWAADKSYTKKLTKMIKALLTTSSINTMEDAQDELIEIVAEEEMLPVAEGETLPLEQEMADNAPAYEPQENNAAVSAEQLIAYYKSKMPSFPTGYGMGLSEFTGILCEESAAAGVSSEIVFAKAMLDTGFLAYEGAVDASTLVFYADEGAEMHAYSSVREGLCALAALTADAEKNLSLWEGEYGTRLMAMINEILGATNAIAVKDSGQEMREGEIVIEGNGEAETAPQPEGEYAEEPIAADEPAAAEADSGENEAAGEADALINIAS